MLRLERSPHPTSLGYRLRSATLPSRAGESRCSCVLPSEIQFSNGRRDSSAPEVVRRGASAFSFLVPHNVRERSADWRTILVWHLGEGARVPCEARRLA